MSELKPCPFCGSEMEFWEHRDEENNHTESGISCTNCGATGPNNCTRELWQRKDSALSVAKTRGATVQAKCLCCKKGFTARVADRNRGWARYCSKSCKAKHQEAMTSQYKDCLRNSWFVDQEDYDDYDPSWDAHKDWH